MRIATAKINKGEWEVKIVAENGRTVTTGMPNSISVKATVERLRGRAYIIWSPGSGSKVNLGSLQNIVWVLRNSHLSHGLGDQAGTNVYASYSGPNSPSIVS